MRYANSNSLFFIISPLPVIRGYSARNWSVKIVFLPLHSPQKVYFLYLLIYFSYFLIGADYEKIAAAYFQTEKRDVKVQKIYFEIGAGCFLPVREGIFADANRKKRS